MKNSVRCHQALQEFLQHILVAENPLVADAEVDEALVAFFNEKNRLVYSSSTSDILLGAMCRYFPEFGKHGGHFLPCSFRALQGWKRRTPPRSRDPHVWCIWTMLILEFLRQGRWSMGVYLLWMVTCHFHSERRHPNSYTGNQLPSSSASSPRRPTAEVQNICGQRHGRVVLSLVRELALDCNSSWPWKPHGTRLQLQLSRLLGGVEQSDRGDKVGRRYPTTGAIRGKAQRTVHRRRPGHPNTKGSKGPKPMEIGPERASVRAASTAPQIVSPSASGLPSLCPEMRKRVAQGDFWFHSHQQCSNASLSVNQFLPRRPRGAHCRMQSWTKNSAAWFPCGLVSSQFRIDGSSQAPLRCSEWPCARCSSLSILCLPWSHCRDSHADQRCSDVWGQKHCSSHIQTGNRHLKRLLTLIRDLQRCEIPWILTHPLTSHVWRIGPICSHEQHHRCHSVIFDHCAFGIPWRLRTKLIAGHCDYQDILSLAEYS